MASTPLYWRRYRPSVRRGNPLSSGPPPMITATRPLRVPSWGIRLSFLLGLLLGSLGLAVLLGLGVLWRAGREGAVSGYGLADDEGVHVVGTLVRVDAFEVCHMLHYAVVEQDAVSAQGITGEGGRFPGLCYVIHLEHRDGRRVEVARVVKTA